MIVADSSPIIALAKQGMLDLLKKCFGKVFIPNTIYMEVMRKKGSPEAVSLEEALNSKWVVVEKVEVIPHLDTKNIGQGEKEAISLAFKHKSILLIDDDSAKKYASIFGIEAHGTFFVIYLATAKKLIAAADARNALKGMISDGFYISSELYSRFLELLESLK
ncbi:DUF3368 domain-containing protein [Candidatus Woesearchaeota archaeon]|nr:DUF3368 domain-containing protein [Candidatus Woesearchaeota archaeon]